MAKRILLLTDNDELLTRFRILVAKKNLDEAPGYVFEYAFSPNNKALAEKYQAADWIKPLKVKEKTADLIADYDVIFSLHCKQLFPSELVNQVRCVNIHPGLNPNNRGWFPQVFSIINGLPSGATIHEIDEKLDHGPVICQKEVTIECWDTSLTAYNKILDAEMELLDAYLESILEHTYTTFPTAEGNLNLKADFDALCPINLDEVDTFRNHINKLRALTHGNYANAYFTDENGEKIYVKIELKREV